MPHTTLTLSVIADHVPRRHSSYLPYTPERVPCSYPSSLHLDKSVIMSFLFFSSDNFTRARERGNREPRRSASSKMMRPIVPTCVYVRIALPPYIFKPFPPPLMPTSCGHTGLLILLRPFSLPRVSSSSAPSPKFAREDCYIVR